MEDKRFDMNDILVRPIIKNINDPIKKKSDI